MQRGTSIARSSLSVRVPRGGFTMLELTAAAGVLGTVFLLTIPLLARVRDTREEAQRRFIAQQEAANVMERLASRASEASIEDAVSQGFLASPQARAVLPDVMLAVTRKDHNDDAGLARVTVAVSWINDAGERVTSVSLDAWFPAKEESP